MAARLLDPHSRTTSLPLQQGFLEVNGATLPGRCATDAFDVLVDGAGELLVVVVHTVGKGTNDPELPRAALSIARDAVNAGARTYEVVRELRNYCVGREAEVALALLRFSQRDSRVELLNAGMPAFVCVLPDGRTTTHAALSSAIGARYGEVHPYELSPLVWGSTWFVMTSGATQGALEGDAVEAHLAQHELDRVGTLLAMQPSGALLPVVESLAGGTPESDATLVVVSTDAARRKRSGIVT
ncbi:MAG: SpoIIE family protein phosphatase [Pseudomonadota bacterium]|nr:MAG: hypothetical protein DIU78_13275 [Pseudomonadota bacterium]